MAGSIQKRGKDTWRVRIAFGADSTGKRLTFSKTIHGSKKDAETALTAMLRQKDLGMVPEPVVVDHENLFCKWKDAKPVIVPPKRRAEATKIYLMLDERTGLVKIGRSINPQLRESTLQSEYPLLSLLAAWDGVAADERHLHERFKTKRVRGEWFDLDVNEIKSILDVEYNKEKRRQISDPRVKGHRSEPHRYQ